MFTVIITEKGGDQRRMDFDKPEVTIGRVQGNDIILPKGNVSKRHSRIVLKDGKFIIVDLKSTNGTYVNGRKITSPLVLKDTDKVYIGDFIINVEDGQVDVGEVAEPIAARGSGPGGGRNLSPQLPDVPAPPSASPTSSLVSNPPPIPKRPSGQNLPPPLPSVRPGAVAPPASAHDLDDDDDVDEEPSKPPAFRPTVPVEIQHVLPSERPSRSERPEPMGRATLPHQAVRDPLAPRGGPAVVREAREAREPAPPIPPAREPLPPVREAPAVREMPPVREGRVTRDEGDPLAARAAAVGARVSVEPPAPRPERKSQPRIPVVEPAPPPPPPVVVAPPVAPRPAPTIAKDAVKDVKSRSTLRNFNVPATPAEGQPRGLELLREVHDRVAAQLDLGRVSADRLSDETLWQRAETAICDLVEQLDADNAIPAAVDQDSLIKDALNELLGLGPLEDLLADDEVTAIMVNRPDRVLVDRGGKVTSSARVFSSDAALRKVIDRLLAVTGAKLDASSPLVDVRLRDGARLTAAVPPLAVRGACLTLRKPRKEVASLEDLVGAGVISPNMLKFLGLCVKARRNIVVCGGAGAGKTALVSALAGAIGPAERVVSVEDVAELNLGNEHWIALEARPADSDGKGGVSVGDVVRAALRMRPDRLLVGDVRGAEALDIVAAMASSCEGAIVAVAGEGGAAALGRLETLARLAAPNAAQRGLRELVSNAAQVVVHVARFADGARRVVSISEVTGLEGEGYQLRELYRYQDGRHLGLGTSPRFYEQLAGRGLAADQGIFR